MKRTVLALTAVLLVVTPLVAASARLEPGAVVCETCHPRVGDFNGDGLDDLIEKGNIYFNRGGRFDAAVSASGLQKSDYVTAVGDFNHDGFDDVITQAPGSPSRPQRLFLNNGSGGFTAGRALPEGSVDALGDINSDGWLDLLLITPTSFSLAVNNGDATFSPVQTVRWPDDKESGTHGAQVVGDLNGDGRADVFFTRNRYTYFYFANEDGSLGAPVRRYTYAALYYPQLADVNGDGHTDIVALGGVNAPDTRIFVLFGDGTGRFPGYAHAFGDHINGNQTQFALGDFFEGGGHEIAVGLREGGVVVLGANGTRLLEIARVVTPTRSTVTAAELRNDGTTDILVSSQAHAARQNLRLVFTGGRGELPSGAAPAPSGRSRAVRAGTNAVPDGRFEVEVTSACSANLSGMWNLRREGIFVDVDHVPGTSRFDAAALDEQINVRIFAEGGRLLEGSVTQKGNRISGILTESNPPCGGLWVAHFVEGTKR
jgi:hypothetical protein